MESVNVGTGARVGTGRRRVHTAIDKRPVEGPVAVHRIGLAGDRQVERRHHGGVEQAVHAYAAEDLAWWADRLGRPLAPGSFGENLTTRGLDVTGTRIGERWQVGDVLLEVADVRLPCATFET